MGTLVRDLRTTLRQLRSTPGFTLTAVLMLAFGLGATTAIFSLAEAILLRPLPFAAPGQLVTLADHLDGTDVSGSTAPGLLAYMRETRGFAGLGAYMQVAHELSGRGEPIHISASRLSSSMFPVLGVAPVLGRTFTQAEDTGRQRVAVLSYGLWQSLFYGSASALGQSVSLDRQPYQVIGVMPRSFEFPLVPGQLYQSQLWTPLSVTPGELAGGAAGDWNFHMVGRLAAGVTPLQAQANAQLVAEEIMRGFPPAMGGIHIHAVVEPLAERTVREARPLIHTLLLAVLVVLLISCANLAGLLLVRVLRRQRETAVRLALGASTAVIVRQSLMETLTLSVVSGLLGLCLAALGLHVGLRFLPETLPRVSGIGLNAPIAAFALLLAVLTGLLCGLLPAIAASRTAVNSTLKEGGRTGSSGGAQARTRAALVVGEIAVALVLLVSAGLLLRSYQKVQQVSLGMRTDHLLTATYDLPRQGYSTQGSVDSFNEALLRRLGQLPGVSSVGLTSQLPAAGQGNSGSFYPEGWVPPAKDALQLAWPSQVLGDYFGTAGIHLLRGRSFTAADRAGSPFVVIINHALAAQYWPGLDPVGRRIHWGLRDTPLPWMTVVGVVADVKDYSADAPTRPQIYQPAGQQSASYGAFGQPDALNGNFGTVVLRSTLPLESIENTVRATIRSVDPQLALMSVESMDHLVDEGEAPRRFNAFLITAFAAIAALLALLGIYSVIAFSVALRTHEMAIRMALGAGRRGIAQMVLASGFRLALLGSALGLGLTLGVTRLLRSLLFEVDPLDVPVLAAAAAGIFVLSLLASALPARRAAAVDPASALRAE